MNATRNCLILFALLWLAPPVLAQNPILDAFRQGREARAQEEARVTMQHEQARIDAERERLRAETDLLREQLRQLQEERARPASPDPTVPTAELVRAAFQRVAARYPDARQYSAKMARLAAIINGVDANTSHDMDHYYAYLQALYLLARWLDGAEIGECPQGSDQVFELPAGALTVSTPATPAGPEASASADTGALNALRNPLFRQQPRSAQLGELRRLFPHFAALSPEAQHAMLDAPESQPIAPVAPQPGR